MNPSKLIALTLVLISLLGCDSARPSSQAKARSFTATLNANGLALGCSIDGALYKSAHVPSAKLSLANAVMEIRHGKALGPWCLVTLHMNPSTSMYVVWNPDTGATHISPGNTPPTIHPTCDKLALVTLSAPHFHPPKIDPPMTLYVNGVDLGGLVDYDWKVSKIGPNRIEWEGMVEYVLMTEDFKENTQTAFATMHSDLTSCGAWVAPSGKSYDVYYKHSSVKMECAGLNVRGYQTLYFIRDGNAVVRDPGCSNTITIENNQLLEKDYHDDKVIYRPYEPAEYILKQLE